jgi:hypothetical protein
VCNADIEYVCLCKGCVRLGKKLHRSVFGGCFGERITKVEPVTIRNGKTYRIGTLISDSHRVHIAHYGVAEEGIDFGPAWYHEERGRADCSAGRGIDSDLRQVEWVDRKFLPTGCYR